MVTGASTAEVAIVLVDARHGVVEQTRRHAAVAGLLRVGHVVLAVNKMDLVDWSEEVFDRIVADFDCFAAKIGLGAVTPLPMSALHGDNVVERSERLAWYAGPPLLEHLETVELPVGEPGELRFPVQWVLRGEERAYAGRVAGGELRPGAEIVALPSGERARVTAVETFDGPLEAAATGQSVSVRIDRELDLSRGDLLAAAESAPEPVRELAADVCWLSERPLAAGARLALKHGTATVRAVIDEVVDRLDLAEAERVGRDGLALNDIGRVRLRVSRPLPVEAYAANRVTGAFVLARRGHERDGRRGHGRLGQRQAHDHVGALARGRHDCGVGLVGAHDPRLAPPPASCRTATWRAISQSSRVASSMSTYQASSSSGRTRAQSPSSTSR